MGAASVKSKSCPYYITLSLAAQGLANLPDLWYTEGRVSYFWLKIDTFYQQGGRLLQGDAVEIEKLAAGMQRLESTDTGAPLADAIREHGTMVKFDPLDEGTVAQLDPTADEIRINDGLKEASPEVLAAHMAHEGTHVQWDAPNSIDQEYHAFKAEAAVWNKVKGDQTDTQCDAVSEMMARGEAEAEEEIRQMYPELPEC